MQLPVIRGVIDRRILVNFRVAPDALAATLPAPFRPKEVAGFGMAGICLIRLRKIRPRWLPAALGFSSENAAHRVAVAWEVDGVAREGVFVFRRDTSSRLNALAGGRVFPGEHHHARFEVQETADHLSVAMRSDDGAERLSVRGRPVAALPDGSVFASLAEASTFFERGSLGYSVTRRPGRFDGIELRSRGWKVVPLAVDEFSSSFFDDPRRFPPGAVAFDHALLMRGIEHEWHGHPQLCAAAEVGSPA